MHTLAERSAADILRAKVLEVADDVFDRYVFGESFQSIADSLPFKVPGWKLRQILMEDVATSETYANANILRSHNLIDATLDYGRQAAALGDSAGLKVAIDTNMKVAAKINAAYSDKSKVELTGESGGPIKLLALTDEQLLRIAAQGIKETVK